MNGYGTGDMLVSINVWIPKATNKEEREILEKLRHSPNFQPNPTKQEKGFFSKMKDNFNENLLLILYTWHRGTCFYAFFIFAKHF